MAERENDSHLTVFFLLFLARGINKKAKKKKAGKNLQKRFTKYRRGKRKNEKKRKNSKSKYT